MAYLTQIQTRNSALSIEFSATIYNAVQAILDYRDYRATVSSLSNLDNAALADLGLHRSEIKAKANQAVYGD